MSEATGQIVPGSKFGDKLTELAREAKVIVEIGTWKGGGSTLCLADGIRGRHDAFLFTLEASRDMYESYSNYAYDRVFRIWGTITTGFPAYFYTLDQDRREQYDADFRACSTAPYVLPILPINIDLLLLDGGEWTSHAEYQQLRARCDTIALDDSNPLKSMKSYAAREDMIALGWTVLADEPDDRNGWFIARRP